MMWGLLHEHASWCGHEAFGYSPSLSPRVHENPPLGLDLAELRKEWRPSPPAPTILPGLRDRSLAAPSISWGPSLPDG